MAASKQSPIEVGVMALYLGAAPACRCAQLALNVFYLDPTGPKQSSVAVLLVDHNGIGRSCYIHAGMTGKYTCRSAYHHKRDMKFKNQS